jgi:hypothetical protein
MLGQGSDGSNDDFLDFVPLNLLFPALRSVVVRSVESLV